MQKRLFLTLVAAGWAIVAISGCQTASQAVEYVSKSDETRISDDRPYAALIEKHANENNVPLELAHAVVFSESTYRADARGAAGEIGLMQIKPATARMLGFAGGAKDLYNPETNIEFGMKYLGKAHSLADGDTCGTILKYNAGHAAKRMNPVSKAYCDKVERLIGD